MIPLWKSLIQPHLDYCCQVWAPSMSRVAIKSQEQILKSFTKKIKGCYHLSYWERLKTLKMLSTQRRIKRYRVIYIWKSIRGLVPDLGLGRITNNPRTGLMIDVPNIRGIRTKHKTLIEDSFKIEGAKLFNSIPRYLREHVGSQEAFKTHLDVFLASIPDEPQGKDWATHRAWDYKIKPSNSLRDWV